MKRLVLLINGDLGLRVLRYIISRDKIEIRGIILNSAHKRSASYLNEVNSILVEVGKKTPVICFEANADSFLQVVEVIQQSDFGISALFGHLLPKKFKPKKLLSQEKSSSAYVFYFGINKEFNELNFAGTGIDNCVCVALKVLTN